MPDARRYLLLQGPVGPFFRQLAETLAAAGHGVHRIRFNGGDRLYARHRGVSDYRGALDGFAAFLDGCLDRERSTDLVLYGDCRPLHRVAIAQARAQGLRVHVFEEGYLRPGWITLEGSGVNAFSPMPRDPDFYRETAKLVPALPVAPVAPMPFARRACEDVLYVGASTLLAPGYRGYRTHKPWSPLREYRAGAARFFAMPGRRRAAARLAADLVAGERPFFLFPLQLDADAQIRVHSDYGRMQPAIEAVIASFAAHAPSDSLLVVSEHPLDQGVVDLGALVWRCAEAAGVGARVSLLRGGTPPALIPACAGLVTVNSTVGLSALEAGRPVAVLGRAVYRIDGLVHGGPLDGFWRDPGAPDAALFAAFRRVLVARTQLAGGYYGPEARAQALEAALPRLLGDAWSGEIAGLRRRRAATARVAEFEELKKQPG